MSHLNPLEKEVLSTKTKINNKCKIRKMSKKEDEK